MDERIIVRKLEILSRRAVVRRWPIEGWQVRLATYQAPGRYEYAGAWRPLEKHAGFDALATVLLKAETEVPSLAVPGRQVYVQFDCEELEGLLSIDGRPYAGIDRNHRRVPAPASGRHAFEIEAISVLRAYCQPELRETQASFEGGWLAEVDGEVESAYYDLMFAWEAVRAMGDARRRQRLSAVLEEALLQVDLTASHDALCGDLRRAREILSAGIAQVAPDPEGGQVYLVGHTHIDTAWLWPLSETVRKCGRTFATAVRLMEQYPAFHFSCSQAQLYAYTREHFPGLYQEIQKWVAAGRWHTTGGMWVESDCNVPSGESLIRQFLHGLQFYQREFGTRPRTCWLPDVFGYPGSLPQILKGCDIPYFLTCKLHWQSTNPFPNHLFWWEGVDGSRVLAHIPRLRSYYNGYPNPEQLTIAWNNFAEKAVHDEVMLPFGYGDGGGGVTAEMMEYVDRARSFPGLPATRTGDEETYFDDALQDKDRLPVWVGELYLETHRGTYTTQSRTKRANRISETLLREAEIWGSIAASRGASISLEPLRDAWQRVLLQQFHDILPGSSIGEVYRDALADHEQAQQTARVVRDDAVRWLADQSGATGTICVFNALSWSRGDPVELTLPDPGGPFHLADAEGRPCPVQVTWREGNQLGILFEPVEVPALGWAAFSIARWATPAVGPTAWDRGLENASLRVELDEWGAITSLLDKRCGRQIVPAGERANLWQLFQDGPEREAAWNVHDTFEKREYLMSEPAHITVVEQGPVRAAVHVERQFRNTRIGYDIALYAHTPRLDFYADVDWQERQTMLKVAFPVTVRSPHATYEIQFGAIQRPTHRNTSWDQQKFEVPAQRWADLSEAGYGVSLLNDGRYGYDVRGNVLRLTVLRGPEYPDPDADRGRHQFAYSLYPHLGDWTQAETVRRARELNAPMLAVPVTMGPHEGAHSYLQVQGPGVVVETLKPAEDRDGWVLRLYEAHGGRGTVELASDRPLARVIACNMVEEVQGEVPVVNGRASAAIGPFEVQTYRLSFV